MAGAIAVVPFLVMNTTTGTAPTEEVPEGSWTMTAFSPEGQHTTNVLNQGFYLSINATKIDVRICNGFGGDIQYIDSATIRGNGIFFTTALCTDQSGPLKM